MDNHFILNDSFNWLTLIKYGAFNGDLIQIIHANIVCQGLKRDDLALFGLKDIVLDFAHPSERVGRVKLATVYLEADFLDVIQQGCDGNLHRDFARQFHRSQVLRKLKGHL